VMLLAYRIWATVAFFLIVTNKDCTRGKVDGSSSAQLRSASKHHVIDLG
jgi:hypothetical protein